MRLWERSEAIAWSLVVAGVAGYAQRAIRIRDGLIEAGAFTDAGGSAAVAEDPVQAAAPH